MMKIMIFVLMILFITPACFVSDAIGQDKDCRAIRDNLKVVRADYRSKYDDYREAHSRTREIHNEIYMVEYKATGKPLSYTYRKCKKEGTEKEAFCKGAIEDYNELEAKKKTAKEQSDAAKTVSNVSKNKYDELAANAAEIGCMNNKNKSNDKDKK